ncbi:MAG TPA: flagellar protein FlaG [Phenylobacterium sp.]|nr:flagellar protein FlaG [Phenylobacterium sp.]
MPSGITSNGLAPRSDPAVEVARASAQAAPAPAPAAAPQPTAAQDLRLNIEHDQASGSFVYKFVDPTSGRVIQQIPSEDLLKLRAAAEYSAGKVIDTKA